ncbi:adenosylcobinamide-GDP ribazoletransferase [Methylobacterium isbiliense]|jgi:adenosylcobinamide-GDP ribazoletransferase|uniref:Adenosylcobinamide-GDP ribazoletransferase n=2 Tax=Methylobacterium isbiliense TaxID=315478 RepID=A0ABQ4S983_9HYPH|nr:adenosylcobinamide-GDP ribazoletransferase [Methylobacterium isbiliense]MDN3623165.1 adenosylcobinamide-GDP ribazoletransferase [Methylobacterium isbiliense]GJD98235.1 Adenosylcobinamide-GDP ribazoletransferase [Methylobacterium isbiliense]
MADRAGWDAMQEADDEFEPPPPGSTLWPPLLDLAACLRFYSRLPVPPLPGEAGAHGPPDFRTAPRMLPIAGLVIALPAALALLGGLGLGLGPYLAATLAALAATLVTGALHEDGLADVADGFGGGSDAARRLDIMRDSRIGAYGTAALILAYGLRIGALATLADRAGWRAALVLLLAAAVSRTAALWPMLALPPARPGGSSHAVGRPTPATHALAWALCLALFLAGGLLGLPWIGLALAGLLAALSAWTMSRMAERLIGGQTGDVIGACQQIAEIAVLLAMLIALPR